MMARDVRTRLGVGVDLGATKLRVCVGDETGRLLWHRSSSMSTPKSVEQYVDAFRSRVSEGVRVAKEEGALAGIGVASTGPLDLKKGGIMYPSNLPYKFIPVVGPLREAFGTDVVLMNDANSGALGEWNFGTGKKHANLVYITISTGIGGGAIVDGHLLIGKDGNAAEIGHLVVDPSGRLTCGCGRKGHWEAYCSGRNMPNFARMLAADDADRAAAGSRHDLQTARRMLSSARSIFGAARKGDRLARRVVREVGELNALGVANVVNMFDPSLVVLGGAVALNNRDAILKPIRQKVSRHAINRAPEIVLTSLGDNVGLIGALSLVFPKSPP